MKLGPIDVDYPDPDKPEVPKEEMTKMDAIWDDLFAPRQRAKHASRPGGDDTPTRQDAAGASHTTTWPDGSCHP